MEVFFRSDSVKRFCFVVYSNAGTKMIKYPFRRGPVLPLLSVRFDWIQTKLKYWKIWKGLRKKLWKIVICLSIQTKCGDIADKILNQASANLFE